MAGDLKSSLTPDGVAADVAYPALRSTAATRVPDPPDFLITKLPLQPSEIGQCFPLLGGHGWLPSMGLNFDVPCHEDPKGCDIAISGIAGESLACRGMKSTEPGEGPMTLLSCRCGSATTCPRLACTHYGILCS